jgi:hypothetical protein
MEKRKKASIDFLSRGLRLGTGTGHLSSKFSVMVTQWGCNLESEPRG